SPARRCPAPTKSRTDGSSAVAQGQTPWAQVGALISEFTPPKPSGMVLGSPGSAIHMLLLRKNLYCTAVCQGMFTVALQLDPLCVIITPTFQVAFPPQSPRTSTLVSLL